MEDMLIVMGLTVFLGIICVAVWIAFDDDEPPTMGAV